MCLLLNSASPVTGRAYHRAHEAYGNSRKPVWLLIMPSRLPYEFAVQQHACHTWEDEKWEMSTWYGTI